MLAVVPFGMFAQSSQDFYAATDDIFNMSYADLGNTFSGDKIEELDAPILAPNTAYVSDNVILKVNDLLLSNPDFDIQEDMISYTKDQKTVFFSANRKLKEPELKDDGSA